MADKKKYAVGIDVGGTNIVTGLVDINGRLHGELSFKTKDYPVFDDFIERLHQDIEALKRAQGPDAEVVGIGIGAPSANYFDGTAEPVNLYWYERGTDGKPGKRIEKVPFVEKVKMYYPAIPVVIDNDANAAALGEMYYGGAKGMNDFIEITLGTGLGSGIVANGQVVYGNDGTAGEIGHIIVRRGGRRCGCGRRGCLETYVSATGIKRTMLEILADDIRPSRLRAVSADEIDSKMIDDAAREGDELALEAFERTGRILGEALADCVAFSYPEAIFLFGGLAKAGKMIFEPTKKYMEENMLFLYKGKVKLLPSGIDGDVNAALLGTSALAWQELRKQGGKLCE